MAGPIHIPLTRAQRRELAGYVSLAPTLFRGILFLVALAVVAAGFRVVHRMMSSSFHLPTHPAVWIIPTVAAGAFVYRRSRRWTGGSTFRRQVRADLRGGMAAVFPISAADVVRIEERADEGPGFVVKTTDGRTYVFAGQYLQRYVGQGFPWSTFEIVEAPESRVFFEIRPTGPSVQASRTRSPLSWDEAKRLGVLNKKYVIVDEQQVGIDR